MKPDLGHCSAQLQAKLSQCGVEALLPVQSTTFKDIKEGSDALVISPATSGKTFAYVLPLVEVLSNKLATGDDKQCQMPIVLVLTESKVMVDAVVAFFSTVVADDIRVLSVTDEAKIDRQEKRLQKGIHIVVGMVERVKELMERGSLVCTGVRHLVLDAVDKVDESGLKNIMEIAAGCCAGGEDKQFQTLVFSDAQTLPEQKWFQKFSKKYLQKNKKLFILHEEEDATKDDDSSDDDDDDDSEEVVKENGASKKKENESEDDDDEEEESEEDKEKTKMQTLASQMLRKLHDVPETSISKYHDAAEFVMKEMGALRAVSAFIANHESNAVVNNNKQHNHKDTSSYNNNNNNNTDNEESAEDGSVSVLTKRPGYISYILKRKDGDEIRGIGYVFGALKRLIPEDVVETVDYITFIKDRSALVFDFPLKNQSAVEDNWRDGKYDVLERLDTLPELENTPMARVKNPRGGGFGGDRGGGRGGFGSAEKRSFNNSASSDTADVKKIKFDDSD